MRTLRKNRTAFRPSLIEIRLEDRVVMSGRAGTVIDDATMAAATDSSTQASQTAAQTLQTRRDLVQTYHAQLVNAENGLKQLIEYQIDTLYANGKPSANDLASLQALAKGAVHGSAFRVSSQLALLPGATDTLVARAQQTMLGSDNTSLANRLSSYIGSARSNRSGQTLMAVINRTIAIHTQLTNRRFVNYLETTSIDRQNNLPRRSFNNGFFRPMAAQNHSVGSDPPNLTGLRLGTGTTGLGFSGTGFGFSGTGLGFSGAGLGFSGTGLGFSGTGLGFSGTGLGFSGAGLGFSGAGLGFSGAGLGFSGAGLGFSGTGTGL